jgi:iron complex transport system substrate-binding protein
VDVRLAGLASVALALLVSSQPTPLELGRGYVVGRQQPDGGFAEPEGSSDPGLTAWAVVAIRASGRDPSKLRRGGASPAEYLASRPATTANELALRILALDALGEDVREPADRLAAMRRPDGRIGPLVNSTIWGVIALRAAGRAAPAASVRYLLRRQHASGGWSWAPRGAPDSNDTAAAIQALRAAGVRGRPIDRAVAFLRRHQNRDGGFELVANRGSDAPSTAWAIQGLLAAGREPGAAVFGYLRRLQRPDGSVRYSVRYDTSRLWTTAQVAPALARRPFPLR